MAFAPITEVLAGNLVGTGSQSGIWIWNADGDFLGGGYSPNANIWVGGFASVMWPGYFSKPPGPFGKARPEPPVTTLFILNAGQVGGAGSLLMVEPSLKNFVNAALAVNLPQNFGVNPVGLASYQPPYTPPSGPVSFNPAPPAYLFVLGNQANGDPAVLRYQVSPSLVCTPAGSTGNPADPTFIQKTVNLAGTSTPIEFFLSKAQYGIAACSGSGTLAVADSGNIGLFQATTGDLFGVVTMPNGLIACSCAYGPDDNLYVFAGPKAGTRGDANTLLKYIGTYAIPYGAGTVGDPVLLSPINVAGSGVVVGGTSDSPLVYLSTLGGASGDATTILQFDGLTGNQLVPLNGSTQLPGYFNGAPEVLGLTTWINWP